MAELEGRVALITGGTTGSRSGSRTPVLARRARPSC